MNEWFLADVFCAPGHAGNPAGVVPDARSLTDAEMQRLAAVIGVSDTAFVFPEPAGARLRWFTPAREVNLCGHATLAAAAVLGEAAVTFRHAGGELTVRTETLGGETLCWLGRPAPALTEFDGTLSALRRALGEPPTDRELTPVLTADGDLILPLRDAATVARLNPDAAALGAASEALGLRGVAAVAVPGPDIFELRVRFFAPTLGVPEDPVTGSLHGALAVWLHAAGLLEHFPDELRALSLQGDPRGRTGVVWLRLTLDPDRDEPLIAEVGGRVTVRPAN